MTDCKLKHIDLGEFVDWVWALKDERDRLKADSEAMSKRLLMVDVVHGPKAEMRWRALSDEAEALRKDAERYRLIRDRHISGDLRISVEYANMRTECSMVIDGENCDAIIDAELRLQK